MKILFVNDYSFPLGGGEIYMHSLAKELVQKSNEVAFFYSSAKLIDLKTKPSVTVLLRRLFNIRSFLAFRAKVSSFRPDIIHVHSLFNEISPSILLAAGNLPIVMTVHNNQILSPVSFQEVRTGLPCKNEICQGCLNCVGFKGVIYEFIKRPIHTILLRRIKLFIVPSKFMYKLIDKHTSYKLVQLYNGFNLPEFKPLAFNNVIVFIGRLSEDKGLGIGIRVFSNVVKKLPKIRLLIVGDGEKESEYKQLVKELSLSKNVVFEGKKNNIEVIEYYKKASLVMVPSIYPDNLPTVCIEAMSVGRPIVASNVGGLPELVENGKTGFLANPKDVKDFSNKIVNILSSKKAALRMSENARDKAVTQFSMDIHIKKMTNIYKSLI